MCNACYGCKDAVRSTEGPGKLGSNRLVTFGRAAIETGGHRQLLNAQEARPAAAAATQATGPAAAAPAVHPAAESETAPQSTSAPPPTVDAGARQDIASVPPASEPSDPQSSSDAAGGNAKRASGTCSAAVVETASTQLAGTAPAPTQLAATAPAGSLLTGIHMQSSGLQGPMAVSQSVQFLTTAVPAQLQPQMAARSQLPSPMRAVLLSAPPASGSGMYQNDRRALAAMLLSVHPVQDALLHVRQADVAMCLIRCRCIHDESGSEAEGMGRGCGHPNTGRQQVLPD